MIIDPHLANISRKTHQILIILDHLYQAQGQVMPPFNRVVKKHSHLCGTLSRMTMVARFFRAL
jgi:hypothetical protein